MPERKQSNPGGRAQRIVSDLAKRGESRAKDFQKTARGIAERSARNRRELASLVQKEIRRQIKGLGLATRDEIDRLQRRVRELEKSTSSRRPSSGARAKRPAKGSSAKKSSER
jgi:polyhydroxyalkanoate synthesis regulator phasin